VTCIDSNTIAVSVVDIDNQVLIIDLCKRSITRRINTKTTVLGIIYNEGSLICCVYDNGLIRIDLKDSSQLLYQSVIPVRFHHRIPIVLYHWCHSMLRCFLWGWYNKCFYRLLNYTDMTLLCKTGVSTVTYVLYLSLYFSVKLFIFFHFFQEETNIA
jgi:hypothetical protein